MKTLDLSNRRFGKLTVQSEVKSYCRSTGIVRLRHWRCICDCGNEKWIASADLTQGKAKSCGCGWKRPNAEAAINEMMRGYRNGAKKRNQEFSLSKEDFISLIERDCFYCGSKPLMRIGKKYYTQKICNGIDRVDNMKGYDATNCVTCCFICNRAKSDMNQNEFFSWLEKVYVKTYAKCVR